MRRRLTTFLSAASLVLCAVTCVLWVLPGARRFISHHGGFSPPSSSFYADGDGLELDISIAEPAVRGPDGDDVAMAAWTSAYRKGCVRLEAVGASVWWGWPWIVSLGDQADRTEFQGYSHGVRLPYWAVIGLTAPLPTAAILRRRRISRRAARGLCPACAYDLRATPDRCPECGVMPQVQPTSGGAHRRGTP